MPLMLGGFCRICARSRVVDDKQRPVLRMIRACVTHSVRMTRQNYLDSHCEELVMARAGEDAKVSSTDLVELIAERFGVRVHRRSVERALARSEQTESEGDR